MFSFLSNSKIVDKALDLASSSIKGIGSFIDEQQLTEEEKLNYRLRQIELYERFLEQARDESSVRSITRRLIVLFMFLAYLSFQVAAIVFYNLGNTGLAELIFENSSIWGYGVLASMSFYLGRHIIAKR